MRFRSRARSSWQERLSLSVDYLSSYLKVGRSVRVLGVLRFNFFSLNQLGVRPISIFYGYQASPQFGERSEVQPGLSCGLSWIRVLIFRDPATVATPGQK